jgi:hypothetical protein
MRTFTCVCGNRLYFDNTRCTRCGREVAWCPTTGAIEAIEPIGDNRYRAGDVLFGGDLIKCHNFSVEAVCNRLIEASSPAAQRDMPLCDACRYNATIPDLSIRGNREKWARLEAAKRRLFYGLDLIGLPRGTAEDGFDPPLSFDFKADAIPVEGGWRPMQGERVFTGHARGKITINIREADDAERERIRVDMGESYRTLMGHFRHEIGHYYWELLIRNRREPQFAAVFGDHNNPSYAEAVDRHYRQGPPADWVKRFPTAYASMHPWEDWAETFAAYLEMVSTLDTGAAWGLTPMPRLDDLDGMIREHQHLGLATNEVNRSMGLPDVLVRNLVPPVVDKMRFIHQIVLAHRVQPMKV